MSRTPRCSAAENWAAPAREARRRGAEVTLLASNLAVAPPSDVEVVETPTAADMAREALARRLPGAGFRPVPVITRAALGPNAGFVGAADLVRDLGNCDN